MTDRILPRISAGALILAGLLAATGPSAFTEVSGGLWEVTGHGEPVRVCVADPLVLAEYEHRHASCTRTVIRSDGQSAVVSYSCSGGGFGQSDVSIVTPRSLRIDTQGILGGAPYNYLLEARRIGDCSHH
jgi:hypothetical protein